MAIGDIFRNLGRTLNAINGARLFILWKNGASQSTGGTFDGTDGTIIGGGTWSELKGVAIGNTVRFNNTGGDLIGSGNFTVEVQSSQVISGTVDYGSGDAITFTVTPEPATMALLVCGGFAVLLRRRRRRRW